jgi:methylase of polypeptide subunit release factors
LIQNPEYFDEATFSDYYENALEIAKKNYANLVTNLTAGRQGFSGKVQFLHSDLLDFLIHGNRELLDKNIVLVANLPYIPEDTFEANVADNVKKFEPKPAFV